MTLTETKKGLSTFNLKVLGITFMFIDHIHEMFAMMGAPDWLDWFGRPVAVLFFFISVEGFTHTRNKKKYLFNLLIGFWIMNIGNQLVQHFFQLGDMGLMNNIFTDLFIAVLTMYGIELIAEFRQTKQGKKLAQGILCILLPILSSILLMVVMTSDNLLLFKLVSFIPSVLTAENNILLYLAPAMYIFRKNRYLQCGLIAIVSLLMLFSNPSAAFTDNTQWMMIFAIIPILLYNGEKGRSMKSFFYIFYPAHIWGLYILASLIFKFFY